VLQTIAALIEKYQRWFGFPLVIAMSLLAFATAIIRPDFLEQLELETLDQRFKLRGPIAPDPRVVIVAVDDASLSEVGRWPWSRDRMATLVDRILGEQQARTLGFDIVFSEVQANPIKESLRLLRDAHTPDGNARQWLTQHEAVGDIDLRLEDVFRRYHDRLVPGYFFYPEGGKAPPQAIAQLPENMALLQPSSISAQFSDDARSPVPRIAAIEDNLPRFTRAADAVGFFNFFPDADGTVRRIPLIAERDGYIFPSLAIQTLRLYLGWPDTMVRIDHAGVENIRLGDHTLPCDFSGSMILNHYGPGHSFRHIPAADILAGRIPPGTLKDKIVLLGVTAVGVFDYRPSPFDSVFPGVEGHAAAISNILNDEEIYRPNSLDGIELLAVLLLSLFCGRLAISSGPVLQSMSIFGVPLLIAGIAFWLFASFGIWLKITYLILGVLMATLPATLIEYITEARKRAFIHDAFARYLAPEVVDDLSRHPEMLKLGGEERHMTAIFSDIASFSTFSEQLTPEELVHFLNRYLTEMSDIILAHGGTIDKYEGDAIIAFFGAPLSMEDHAVQSVLAAMEQQQRLVELRRIWLEEGLPAVHIRIGINSGPMVVGNMGTDTHMNYTMMGDHVNLASRLEGVCKVYRTPILISRDTYLLVREQVAARFVDRVRVVGREKPVDLYEPLGLRDAVPAEVTQRCRTYEKAWSLMLNHHFNDAGQILAGLHKAAPDDGLFEVMLARTKQYAKTPPPNDWDGVFILDSK